MPSWRCIPLWDAKPVTAMRRIKSTTARGRTFFPISENDLLTSHRAMVAMSFSVPMILCPDMILATQSNSGMPQILSGSDTIPIYISPCPRNIRNDVMITARDLTKNFDGFMALDGISFSFEDGEIFGIIGHNGAGKTTLLKIISGLIAPTSGELFINGMDVIKNPMALKENLGYLPGGVPALRDHDRGELPRVLR